MSNTNNDAKKRVDIGGQAVMEGVMMKAPNAIAVSVRRPDNAIVTKLKPYTPLSAKHPWMGKPFLRGIVNMVTMLTMGMDTLQQSTNMLGILDEEPTKFEKWLSKKLGKGIDKIVMGVAIVLAVALSILLFFLLPELFARLLKQWMPDAGQNWIINLLSGLFRILILMGYMIFCGKVPDVRRTFEYHGAEHKTVYCNENDLPLCPENARGFTTLHPRCGTSFLLIVFTISIVLFTLVGYQGTNVLWRLLSRLALFPFVAGISYEVLKGLAHSESKLAKILRWPGMQMQRLTTRQPTDEMLEVAIVSMNAALHGIADGIPTTPEGYAVFTDYRMSDPEFAGKVFAEQAAKEAAEAKAADNKADAYCESADKPTDLKSEAAAESAEANSKPADVAVDTAETADSAETAEPADTSVPTAPSDNN